MSGTMLSMVKTNQAVPPLHMTDLPRGGGLNPPPKIRLVEHAVSCCGNLEIVFFGDWVLAEETSSTGLQ